MAHSQPPERLLRRQEKHEKILDAGEACLREHGYEAMKMSDVAVRAGVAKGTVYRYFDSRDALCAAIAERHIAARLPKMQALASDPNPASALRAVLECALLAFEQRPEHTRSMLDWWRRPHLKTRSPSFIAYRARVQEMLGLIEGLIARGVEGGVFAPTDNRRAAIHLWSSILGLVLLCANPLASRARLGDAFEPLAQREFFIESLLRGLRAEGAR
ncbi:MAG: TetR/AcrR family transcriptional regulator [Myxococcota bacterium]